MRYTPKLSHVVFASLLSILFSYLWSMVEGKAAQAMFFGAGLFLFISSAILFSIIEGSHYYSVTAYIEALVRMDTDLRNALAFNVPALRLIAKHGKVQTLFADTHATKEHIHLFLMGSTKTQTGINTTPPKRDWHTADRPAWAWQEIYDWMLAKKYVSPFATGPDSYEYIGTAYQNLAIFFLSHEVPNLGTVVQSYGSEVERVEFE